MGKKIIDADYSQTFLFPPDLEQMVPDDHPARFLRAFVEAQDLDALGFLGPDNDDGGRPAYAPSLLLKVWLHGFMHGLRSTRKLERACREHVSLLWLTGLHAPDHNTLWRFFRDHREAVKNLFTSCVRFAADHGMVSLALHAVDGTKIAAAASHRTSMERAAAEEMLARLDAAAEAAALEVETAEEMEAGSYRLPAALTDPGALRSRIEKALQQHPHSAKVSVTDPDAHRMPIEGLTRPGHYAQALVDENRLVVAADVPGTPNDAGQLNPMIEQAERNLGAKAEETVADAGYSAPEELAEAEKKGRSVTVSMKGGSDDRTRKTDDPYHRSKFAHDAENDCYHCPGGRTLTFQRETPNTQGTYMLRVYHCRTYATCERRWECSRNKRGRTVKRNPEEAAVSAMRRKERSAAGRARLRRRREIVEPVFGTVKEARGFRRFTVWGLESVRAQWLWVTTAYNLNKMAKAWAEGRLKMA